MERDIINGYKRGHLGEIERIFRGGVFFGFWRISGLNSTIGDLQDSLEEALSCNYLYCFMYGAGREAHSSQNTIPSLLLSYPFLHQLASLLVNLLLKIMGDVTEGVSGHTGTTHRKLGGAG